MPMIDLNETEIETLIYALGLAAADLKESVSDPSQAADDKQAWSEYITEIEQVNTKLHTLSHAA
jgi:hypothetical protein